MGDGDGHDSNTLCIPFIFVPHGEEPPADWFAAYPGAIRVPATFTPGAHGQSGRVQLALNDALESSHELAPPRAQPVSDAAESRSRVHDNQGSNGLAEQKVHRPADVGVVRGKKAVAVGTLSLESKQKQNIDHLARIIESEAGGTSDLAMRAVGWTVRNRMTRNQTDRVDQVERAFAHRKTPSAGAIAIAKKILDGKDLDPTGGATHFYSPDTMPRAPASTQGLDSGETEQVPGVTDTEGNPVRSRRPVWSLRFKRETVPGIPEHTFKFYRATNDGPVQ